MDVRFSPEQDALRASVAHAVSRLAPSTVASLGDADRRARLASVVGDAGWLELRNGEPNGAPIASAVDAAIVAEELGRGLADVAFVGPTIAADLRRRAGAPPAGRTEAVALRIDLGGFSPAAMAFDIDDGVDAAVGLDPDGRLVRYEIGVDRDPVDLTRRSAAIGGTRTPVVDATVDGENLAGCQALALALSCADLVGVMSGAVAFSCAYATDRRQYGVAVGSFQAVQHLLADAHVATEGSRSIALHAAWAVDALEPAEALLAASMAKAYCTRAARDVCETAIQVHGGIGNTWDCLAHLFLRRTLISGQVMGGVGPNMQRVIAGHGLVRC